MGVLGIEKGSHYTTCHDSDSPHLIVILASRISKLDGSVGAAVPFHLPDKAR